MIFFYIVFGVLIALGLFHFVRIKSLFPRIILITQIVSMVSYFIDFPFKHDVGLGAFLLSLALVIVYALTGKEFSKTKKTLLALSAGILLLVYLYKLNHLPWANYMGSLLVIPIGMFFFMLSKIKAYRNEIGFMTILAVMSAVAVLQIFFDLR